MQDIGQLTDFGTMTGGELPRTTAPLRPGERHGRPAGWAAGTSPAVTALAAGQARVARGCPRPVLPPTDSQLLPHK